jgi:peroxiredoxin
MDSLQKRFQTIPQGEANKAERIQIVTAWDSIARKQVEFSKDFILKHALSPASYYALYQRFSNNEYILIPETEVESFKIVASSLKAMYPESQYTQAILKHLKTIGKQFHNQQLRQLIDNSENALPEIRLQNAKGDTVLLSSLKGKYIILDFTVLNAKESANYINSLKQVYQKFKNKGVCIYQVCLDNDQDSWKNLVSRYGIEWNCVRDSQGYSSRIWNIQSIPTNYIISPTFEIVGKNLIGKRLEERLTDLLKK